MDIKQNVSDLLAKTKLALLGMVSSSTPLVIDAIGAYIANAEGRFSALLSNLSEGGDVKFLLSRLKDEKDILESEILSFIVIGKGAAQNIVNSVQDIILNAIEEVLPEKVNE